MPTVPAGIYTHPVTHISYTISDIKFKTGLTSFSAWRGSNITELCTWTITSSEAPVAVTWIFRYDNKYALHLTSTAPFTLTRTYNNRTKDFSSSSALAWSETEPCYDYTDTGFLVESNFSPALGDASTTVDPSTMNNIGNGLVLYGGYIDGYDVTYDLDGCTGAETNPTIIPPNAVITNAYFTTESEKYAFNSGSVWIDGSGFDGAPIQFVWEPEIGHLKIGVISSSITVHVHATTDPYSDIDGESEIPGGGSVGVPGLPGLTATSAGVIGLFAPSASQMQLLADYMWTDFGGEGTTTEDILKEIVQALKRLISSPLNYVVGLNIIPSQGLSIGDSQNVRFGFVNSNVSMPKLTNQYFTVDCGSLSFSALCGDTFLDYAPYSKFSIYLPYIGVKDVDANDFVGHTIGVMYRGDVVTGGVTAYILKDGSVMYQYSGCCALNVPLSSDSWGETISGAVQIATSMVAGLMTGGAAGVASGAAKGAASVAANPSLLSPQVMRSGAVSGGAGCMGVQYPFVIREAVRFHSTTGFNTISGYPSYYFKSLSSVHGFTTCLDVHLTNITGTQGEIAEIEKLLKEGVIF